MNWGLRFKYVRDKVKRKLNTTAKPRRTATPIQNLFLSGVTSNVLKTATPSSVTLSEA